jgi:hypothetical protein
MTEHEPLTPFVDGVWRATQPVRILGTHLTASMTVLRLHDGGSLVYSPVELTPARQAAVAALGPVAHLYSPNLFHHLSLGDWSRAFPQARVHAPGGLQKKRPDLRIDRVIGKTSEPAFEQTLDEMHIDGFRLNESVLFHRPSNTLVVADLLHNVGRPEGGWTRFYTKTMGFYDRVALSRVLRWTAFSDAAAARRSIEGLLALPFDNLAMGHGEALASGGKEALAQAFTWLPG